MKKGKFTSLMLAGMMAVTTLAGCGSGGKQAASKVDTSEAAQGKVLNIYCWNTEFQDRFEYFKKSGKLPSDVKVNFVVTPNENNAYQNALDAALLKQNDVPADEKIDIFLIEADYALKYVDSDYTLDVVNDRNRFKGRAERYNMAGNTGIVRIQTFHCKRCSRHG